MSEIRADRIYNEDGSSGPSFPNGIPNLVLSGITTVAAGSTSAPSITPSGDSNTGVFFPSADTIAFAEGGAEAARFDSSGRLLVGTNSARSNLYNSTLSALAQFEDTASPRIAVISSSNVNARGGAIVLAHQVSNTVGGNTVVSNGDQIGSVEFQGSDGAEFVQAAKIDAFVDGTPGANDMPGRLVFSTTADGASSPTERMKISQNGQVQVSNALNPLLLLSTSTAGTANYLLAGNNNVTTSVYIWTNGNIQNTNGSYTTISDAKLKENIVDAGSQWDDIKSIRIRNWNFKEETGYETHRQIGPIAQELEQVCPGLVFDTPDRDEEGNDLGTVTKGVNQSVLYMKAIKALQEAQERIETLEAQNTTLQQQNTEILARLDAAGI